MHLQPGILQEQIDGHRREDPGGQCRDRHTADPHVEHMEQDVIPRDVDHIHEEADDHADPGIAGAAEEGRPGIVDGDKGDRRHGDHVIGIAVSHDLIVDIAEDQGQQDPLQGVEKPRDDEGDGQDCQHQLIRCPSDPGKPPLSQILSHHHRAARGQGCHQGQDQHHDGIHQRDG